MRNASKGNSAPVKDLSAVGLVIIGWFVGTGSIIVNYPTILIIQVFPFFIE